MTIFNRIFKARDKPKNILPGSTYSFFFGSTSSGKSVNERTKPYMEVAQLIAAIQQDIKVVEEPPEQESNA